MTTIRRETIPSTCNIESDSVVHVDVKRGLIWGWDTAEIVCCCHNILDKLCTLSQSKWQRVMNLKSKQTLAWLIAIEYNQCASDCSINPKSIYWPSWWVSFQTRYLFETNPYSVRSWRIRWHQVHSIARCAPNTNLSTNWE